MEDIVNLRQEKESLKEEKASLREERLNLGEERVIERWNDGTERGQSKNVPRNVIIADGAFY